MLEIEDIRKEYDEVIAQLGDPELISDFEKFEELSKRKKFLDKIIERDAELKNIAKI